MYRRSENYFTLGLHAYEEDRLDQSIHFFKKVLEFENEEDQYVNAVINIAQIYDELDEDEESLYWYQYLLDTYQCEEGLYGLAMIYEKIGREEEAIYYYRKAIEKNDTYRDAMFFLANLYDRRHEFEKAIEMYHLLLTKCPDDYMTYNNLGSIYEELCDYEKAKDYLIESLRCRSDYFRSHFNLGIVYKKLKNHRMALEEYEKAWALNENCSDIYLNMAIVYKEEQNFLKALEILTRGIETAPSANLYYNRACLYVLLKKKEAAEKDLIIAFQQNAELISYAEKDPELRGFLTTYFLKENKQRIFPING